MSWLLWIYQCGGCTEDPAASIVCGPSVGVSITAVPAPPCSSGRVLFVYHHGKLSSSPAVFQCSVSDHDLALKQRADTPLHVLVAIMLKSYLHTNTHRGFIYKDNRNSDDEVMGYYLLHFLSVVLAHNHNFWPSH